MKIGYGIITLNQLEWVVDKHLPSIDFDLVDTVHVHVSEAENLLYHGQPAGYTWAELVAEKIPAHKRVLSESIGNLGVAPGWNKLSRAAFSVGCDAVIIANDDIILDPPTLPSTVLALQHADFVACPGQNMFSFFGMTRRLYEAVGEFDENFWPAYYEDNDYAYRMKLRGFATYTLAESGFFHQGSATIKNYTAEQTAAHHRNFSKNGAYYVSKWGGLPHYERYQTPFNFANFTIDKDSPL
jgi:GT2 family glycosyltransferase